MNWSGVNTTRRIWVMWIGYLEKLWPWVRLNWWCVAIWCQWIFSSQDRKFWHVTWVTHTHNDQLNASHNGENAKMTHNGILAKRIIRIRLTKSYEVYDFWTCLKKRVAHLTPQVFGNSYNWVWKKKRHRLRKGYVQYYLCTRNPRTPSKNPDCTISIIVHIVNPF
jgi:hypothetical protein